MHATVILPLLASAIIALSMPASAADAIGATRIAQWKDDRAAALVLMFDDSVQTDITNAIPELTKRGLTGTFYINPGSGHFAAQKAAWQKVPAAGFELANHTMTHAGVKNAADAEREFGGCTDAIHQLTPDQPWPRLVSYGQPGGLKPENWTLTKAEVDALLTKNHLVSRPDFGDHGSAISLNTAADMLKRVDRAIETHIFEFIVFHGVGGDWIVTPMPVFTEFLDGLKTRADKVWITNHIPVHQYATERDAAAVKPGAITASSITLSLTCTADPAFYTLPLTLVTTVPAAWSACTITQGKRQTQVTATGGAVRYDAVPGADAIVISSTKK